MQLIIPARVATWLRESEDPDHPELLRELRIQLASEGSEHHPARITALVSLWHDMVDSGTGRVSSTCLVDAEARDLGGALTDLDARLRSAS